MYHQTVEQNRSLKAESLQLQAELQARLLEIESLRDLHASTSVSSMPEIGFLDTSVTTTPSVSDDASNAPPATSAAVTTTITPVPTNSIRDANAGVTPAASVKIQEMPPNMDSQILTWGWFIIGWLVRCTLVGFLLLVMASVILGPSSARASF